MMIWKEGRRNTGLGWAVWRNLYFDVAPEPCMCLYINDYEYGETMIPVVRVSKHIWLKFLSSRYPHLEFIRTDTIRSLLDTHRNQGIINVLLCVKGKIIPWQQHYEASLKDRFIFRHSMSYLFKKKCNRVYYISSFPGALNVEEINRQLKHHLLERRNQNGEFMFPRLRQSLVSCWGNYAWENTLFRLENHIILANAVYRARPVSDNNIQVSCLTDIQPIGWLTCPCSAVSIVMNIFWMRAKPT